MPGESTPVYPDWFTSSVKAIYDPKKQGLTNYDVIESYAEDFTTWKYHTDRATLVITANTLNITNVKTSTNNLIEDKVEPFSDLVIKVTGVSNEIYLLVRNANSLIQTIKTDGVYKVSSNNKYIAFAVNKTGDCNITITQLPTSILKDLSGNGNHAYLYGGKGKLNSGMGVYKFDFLSDLRINSAYLPYTERQDDKICSLAGHPAGWLFQFTSLSDIPAFKVEVKGIVNDKFVYRWYDENGNRGADIAINEDGIYELPMSYSVENNTGVGIVCSDACVDNVCFTQIPDYPDQLCYDGNMCAVAYEFPILTDYTIIADRTWFNIRDISCFIGKRNRSGDNLGAFEFEFRANKTFSFGGNNDIIFADNNIVYQTKNSYNGAEIKSGSLDDTDVLIIGAAQRNVNDKAQDPYIGCHGAIIVADRSFTEDEITWLKENIYNIEI